MLCPCAFGWCRIQRESEARFILIKKLFETEFALRHSFRQALAVFDSWTLDEGLDGPKDMARPGPCATTATPGDKSRPVWWC